MNELSLKENGLGFEIVDGDRMTAFYRAVEELPRTESPKPCFAPIYTPSGGLVTEYRPADHAWHTGLYFGWVHVNDANLGAGHGTSRTKSSTSTSMARTESSDTTSSRSSSRTPQAFTLKRS